MQETPKCRKKNRLNNKARTQTLMNKKSIAILLATYNGERYLQEQLDSLYAQTYKEWTLYVHDDGSTDETLGLLKQYATNHDNMVMLDYPPQHGAKNNFFSLLKQVKADYYFFCDQDDKWCERKIETQMERMHQLEKEHKGKPLLVHSDTFVTDANLTVTHPSLWKLSGAHPEFLSTFDEAAATPFVTGCTMLFNHKAKQSIVWEKIHLATMHDAYITLCILRAGGTVCALHKPLLFYRQHGANTLGASDLSKHGMAYKLRHLKAVLRKNIALLRMLDALGYGSSLI